ncbi:MAG: hypothetical protein U9N59_03550 [Campylobacterota bacterium]|nr:hypothetical protein [Campylobacterota bacterium]
MDNSSTESLKNDEKSFLLKDFIPLKFIYSVMLIIIVTIILMVGNFLYEKETNNYKETLYSQTGKSIVENCDNIYKDVLNDTMQLSHSISKHYDIKTSLLQNNSDNLNLSKIIEFIKKEHGYNKYRIEILDKYGNKFQKSWTDEFEDNIDYMKLKIAKFIKLPRAITNLYASNYGYTIKNMIPIYDDKELLGIFISYFHFDDLVTKLKKSGYDAVVVLNKIDSSRVNHNRSHSKKFIDGYYIVNANIDSYLERVIREEDIDNFYKKWDKTYNATKSEEYLIIKYEIEDFLYKKKAQVFMFKPIEDINLDSILFIKNWYIIFSSMLIIISIFIIYYLYVKNSLSTANKENSSLIMINEDLKDKTDQLDYNEKKIENLFNSQPNLMIMHNGFEIIDANKRFMGFFNRFGTFDGFKKEHKCVSELFEEYDAPNYIWEQYIDGIFWIDYILENPRRLYKIVMSIENRQGEQEQHHFIVKLNEIKYAGIVSERLIIIALVDMTQDMKNYKTLEELSKIEEKSI